MEIYEPVCSASAGEKPSLLTCMWCYSSKKIEEPKITEPWIKMTACPIFSQCRFLWVNPQKAKYEHPTWARVYRGEKQS